MKKIIISLLTIILISCSENGTDVNYDIDYKELQTLPLTEIIKKLNQWHYDLPKITSYIDSRNIVIKPPDENAFAIPLPEDSFFVAIAPYINYTHSCATHYFSSCEAELKEK